MEVSQETKELLAETGFDPNFGARPLRRKIQDLIEDRLSEEYLASKFGPRGYRSHRSGERRNSPACGRSRGALCGIGPGNSSLSR